MKVIHLVESTATGTLSMVAALANLQSANGAEVSIIYSVRPETPKNLHEYFECGIGLHEVNMNGLKNKMLAISRVRFLYHKKKADFIFMHSSFAGFIGRISGLFVSGRFFYIPHCISILRQDVGFFKRSLFLLLEWVGSIKKSKFIACSRSEQLVIKSRIPFRECLLLENAVDLDKWIYDIPWKKREKIVITVGQIRSQKDPEAFALVCRQVQEIDSDIRFLWVGDGFLERDKNILIDSGVEILGWKTPEEVSKLLGTSKIFLSTSRWEGLPVAPIEAMLSGCLAILANCYGNKDLVDQGENGFLFDKIENAVDLILANIENDQSEVLVEKAIDHCRSYYSFDRYSKDVDALMKTS